MGKLIRRQRREEAAKRSASKAFKAMDKHAAKMDKIPDPTPEQLEDAIQEIEKDADAQVYADAGDGVPHIPDLIQLYTDSPKAPCSGQSHYFVISSTPHKAVLLHPFTLTQFTLPGDEMHGSKTVEFGEKTIQQEKMASLMERLMKEYVDRNKQFPEQLVRRVIAALRGQQLHEVIKVKPTREVPKAFREKNERRPGVIDALRELVERPTGASKVEILEVLKKRFPDRSEKGMAHTIDCQLRELPKKHNLKTLLTEDAKRGKVFRMVPANA